MKKRLLAAILLLALLAGVLAGCGQKEKSATQAEQPPAGHTVSDDVAEQSAAQTEAVTAKYAYKAEYLPLTAALSDVYGMCASQDGVYLSGVVQSKTGSRDGVFRVDVETGECTELQGLALPTLPDGWDGGAHVYSIQTADDGTLWLECSVFSYRYNLPEDFDPENDVQWNYYEEGENYTKLLHVTPEGEQLAEVTLQPQGGDASGVASICVDASGNVYVNDWQNVYVYDAEGNALFDMAMENGRTLCRLGDQVGVSQSVYLEDGSGVSFCFRPIDVAAQSFGEERPLPYGASQIYPGGGLYDLYYTTSRKIFGYRFDTQTSEKLVDWLECDVNPEQLSQSTMLPDGRVAAALRTSGGVEFVVLTRVDASTLPQKTLITLACMYLPYDMSEDIIAFNRANEQYRIVVNDYSEYALDGGEDAALTRLNTEILSGKTPDLFVSNDDMPISLYASKGLLADLYELIDEDETLGRAAFVQPVLQALETDGKLYELPSTFYVQTVMGLSKYVGGYETWTLADLQDAMSKLPEDASIMNPQYTKIDVLRNCVRSDLGAYLDWQSGAASFDSENFIELLEFCNTFPDEFDSESFDWAQYSGMQTDMNNGRQLLSEVTVSSFTNYAVYCLGYDGGVTFVGYPSSDNSAKSTFCKGASFAISASSENRDAAWAFVRSQMLDLLNIEDPNNVFWGFPMMQAGFDAAAQRAMTVEYRTDENGQTLYDEDGAPVKQPKASYTAPDGSWVTLYELSQADIDAVTNLINSTTCVYQDDRSVMEIVEDEASAFFAGGKSAQDAAKMIQNRVSLYMAEQG